MHMADSGRPSVADLMAELFTFHGFRVSRDAALEGKSGSLYEVPVLAEDDRRFILVDCEKGGPDGRTLDASAMQNLADVRDDVGADLAVVCHAGDGAQRAG